MALRAPLSLAPNVELESYRTDSRVSLRQLVRLQRLPGRPPPRFRLEPLDSGRRLFGVRVGSPLAVGVGSVAFGVSHPEWLAASVFALLMIGLCRATGNLFASTVAHAVTNLMLALYVLQTGSWVYW